MTLTFSFILEVLDYGEFSVSYHLRISNTTDAMGRQCFASGDNKKSVVGCGMANVGYGLFLTTWIQVISAIPVLMRLHAQFH
jgi:hypothetical protein